MMRMAAYCLLTAGVLAGCGGTASEPDPTATPDAYTDAEAAADYAEGLVFVLADDPAYVPEWWPLLLMDENGVPRVEVEDDWAYLFTHLGPGDEALALTICNQVKPYVYDDEGVPYGINDVMIMGDGDALADCDVPVLNR